MESIDLGKVKILATEVLLLYWLKLLRAYMVWVCSEADI